MGELPIMIPAAPEMLLAVAIMATMILGVFWTGNATKPVAYLSVGAVLAVGVVLGWIAAAGDAYPTVAFGGMFVNDALAVFTKFLVLIGGLGALMMALGYQQREKMQVFELSTLMLFAILGMMLMVSAGDLISLYMGLELQSLALYVLVAIRRDSVRAAEAGLKYFVLGAVSSGMLLYGASLIYGFAGTTNLAAIGDVLARMMTDGGLAEHSSTEARLVLIALLTGVVFLLAGMAFKISAVPFHMWTPDVYHGAPLPVTAFLASAPKVAAIALIIRLLFEPLAALVESWQAILWLMSLGSMIIGSFAAIAQTNLKRMLAYSSIGHMGYALVGLASGNVEGAEGAMVYLALYMFMSLGAFAVILGMRRQGQLVNALDDLRGLSVTHPLMALTLTLLMFSMAGIPPLAGFFGKLMVFAAAIRAELFVLAVVGVLISVVSAFYYLRLIRMMYFEEPGDALDRQDAPELGWVMTVSVTVVLLFWLFPAPIVASAELAAAGLFAG